MQRQDRTLPTWLVRRPLRNAKLDPPNVHRENQPIALFRVRAGGRLGAFECCLSSWIPRRTAGVRCDLVIRFDARSGGGRDRAATDCRSCASSTWAVGQGAGREADLAVLRVAHRSRGDNTAVGVWADTAYRSKKNEAWLANNAMRSCIHRKKPRRRPMSAPPGQNSAADTAKVDSMNAPTPASRSMPPSKQRNTRSLEVSDWLLGNTFTCTRPLLSCSMRFPASVTVVGWVRRYVQPQFDCSRSPRGRPAK